MKKFVGLLASVFAAIASQAGSHAFVEPSGTEPVPYLWSYVNYWKTCNDYPNDVTKNRGNISSLGGPGDGKILYVDSNLLTPEHPLKIDDGRFVSVGQAYIGTFGGAPYGDVPHIAALEVGSGAVLVTADLNSNFIIGDREGAMGALILDSGSIVSNNKFRVGASGVGIVTNNGGRVWTAKNQNGYGIYIGYGATGVGSYVQNSGFSEFRNCEIGTGGNGTLEFRGGAANVSMRRSALMREDAEPISSMRVPRLPMAIPMSAAPRIQAVRSISGAAIISARGRRQCVARSPRTARFVAGANSTSPRRPRCESHPVPDEPWLGCA